MQFISKYLSRTHNGLSIRLSEWAVASFLYPWFHVNKNTANEKRRMSNTHRFEFSERCCCNDRRYRWPASPVASRNPLVWKIRRIPSGSICDSRPTVYTGSICLRISKLSVIWSAATLASSCPIRHFPNSSVGNLFENNK